MKRPFSFLASALLLACTRVAPTPNPPAPTPTPIDVGSEPTANTPDRPATTIDHPADHGATASAGPDWAEAYSSAPLTEARVASLQSTALSGATEASVHAAFVLGRRTPRDRLNAAFNVMPARVAPSFARGAAGRALDQQPDTLPASLGAQLSVAHPDLALASWVFRARKPVPGITNTHVRVLLASARLDDQLTGARLLVSPSVTPPFELIEFMQPVAMAAAFNSIAKRGSTVSTWWRRWVDSVALRVRSNPRTWANTWLALSEYAPRREIEVGTALLTAIGTFAEVQVGDPAVDAAFRCTNAALLDVVNNRLQAASTCATGEHLWRSQVATAHYLRDNATDPQRAALLQALAQAARDDVRVLEAIPEAAVQLPPSVAAPILRSIASHRDPGVLASLLEHLALHVQHARALPSSLRTQLIQAPFALDEAPSIEARLQAIALARALEAPFPPVETTIRAVRQAIQPDASVTPAPSTVASDANSHSLAITTRLGTVRIALDGSFAPQAVGVVLRAAREGRYNGTGFHRVVPAFVAQGGDPRGDGYGGSMTLVPTELSGQRFERGAVGVALAGLDTGGMQFFIMTADAPHLDARYPWIGRVVEGMAIVDELMVGDTMERVEVTPQNP